MIFSKKGERDDEHENSGEDTPCTDMAADNGAAPRVQACDGHRDPCADDRRRPFAPVRSAARHTAHKLKGAMASVARRRHSHAGNPLYRRTS